MLQLTGEGSTQTCDGVTRRDFLQVGTLGAIGLSLPDLLAAQAQGAVDPKHDDRARHHDLQPWRPQPDGHLRS